ncbi:MAG: hypothetical protein CMO01_16925 [Thalassobius sp.]|nr:hypothetical protein [Thalassovita sp.]
MSKQIAINILKQHSQRATFRRIAVLEFLMEQAKAYSLTEMERLLSINIDRATIYRILQIFETEGLVIKMIDLNGTCIYMFNNQNHNDSKKHPHLRCKKCDKIVCLPCLPNEYMDKLDDFEINQIYFLMEGTCKECLSN